MPDVIAYLTTFQAAPSLVSGDGENPRQSFPMLQTVRHSFSSSVMREASSATCSESSTACRHWLLGSKYQTSLQQATAKSLNFLSLAFPRKNSSIAGG
jgi:hypothetical protein